jgi:O-antigen ligase
MPAFSSTVRRGDLFLMRLADWLVVLIAIALPWSTSATTICIVAWLVVVLPTLDLASVRRELESAAGGLPVLLWCLGVIGMLWADVSWTERLQGLGSFHRLLVIPLLLAQFRRSEHGVPVIYGF